MSNRGRLSRAFDPLGTHPAHHREGDNTLAQLNVVPELAARLAQITDRYPALRAVAPWPESNHSTFAFRGVPAMAFSAHGAFALAHSPTQSA
jgi:hypothetical protein